MPNPIALSANDDYSLLVGASKVGDQVTLGPERLTQAKELAFYVVFGPSAKTGTVMVEAAHSVGHVGEWAPLHRIDFTSPGKVHYVAITGTHLAIRLRVADAIVGDTASFYGSAL